MYRYQVVDTQPLRRRMVLSDDAGRYHVARTFDPMPSIGDTLNGDAPSVGPTLLRPAQGPALHVVIERVCCTQLEALEQLHAPPAG